MYVKHKTDDLSEGPSSIFIIFTNNFENLHTLQYIKKNFCNLRRLIQIYVYTINWRCVEYYVRFKNEYKSLDFHQIYISIG